MKTLIVMVGVVLMAGFVKAQDSSWASGGERGIAMDIVFDGALDATDCGGGGW